IGETVERDRSQNALAAREMMVGQLMADARAARHLAEAQAAKPLLLDETDALLEQPFLRRGGLVQCAGTRHFIFLRSGPRAARRTSEFLPWRPRCPSRFF